MNDNFLVGDLIRAKQSVVEPTTSKIAKEAVGIRLLQSWFRLSKNRMDCI